MVIANGSKDADKFLVVLAHLLRWSRAIFCCSLLTLGRHDSCLEKNVKMFRKDVFLASFVIGF